MGLPLGTSKNWAHVVDARAGPGHNTKKMMVPVVLKPSFVPVPAPLDIIDSDKSFIHEDEDTDSMSFYSDTDSSVSKTSKNDLAAHTDDEGFEGPYDKTFKKNVRIKEMFGNI